MQWYNSFTWFYCRKGCWSSLSQNWSQTLQSELPYYHSTFSISMYTLCANIWAPPFPWAPPPSPLVLLFLLLEPLPFISSPPLFTSIASGVQEQCSEEELGAHHLLLFISALIPKAMSSLLTSIVIELSNPDNVRWRECCSDDSLLEDVLLEVQRLWPPFFGGRRISTQVCSYKLFEVCA